MSVASYPLGDDENINFPFYIRLKPLNNLPPVSVCRLSVGGRGRKHEGIAGRGERSKPGKTRIFKLLLIILLLQVIAGEKYISSFFLFFPMYFWLIGVPQGEAGQQNK